MSNEGYTLTIDDIQKSLDNTGLQNMTAPSIMGDQQQIASQQIAQAHPAYKPIQEPLMKLAQNLPQGALQTGGEIAGDFNQLIESLPKNIGQSALNFGLHGIDFAKEAIRHPLKTAGHSVANIPLGLGNLLRSVINQSLNVGDYLGEKGVPGFKETQGALDFLKIPENFGIEKALIGEPTGADKFIQEAAQLAIPAKKASFPVRAKPLMKQLSKEKLIQHLESSNRFNKLFEEGRSQGATHAKPYFDTFNKAKEIVTDLKSLNHEKLINYIKKPTTENAHWAQSHLGQIERDLTYGVKEAQLPEKTQKILKKVRDTKKEILDQMFKDHPKLKEKYQNIRGEHKEKVIPYDRAKPLTEYEAKRMYPKTAIKQLKADDQFMIEVGSKHPGFAVHRAAKTMSKSLLADLIAKSISNIMP